MDLGSKNRIAFAGLALCLAVPIFDLPSWVILVGGAMFLGPAWVD